MPEALQLLNGHQIVFELLVLPGHDADGQSSNRSNEEEGVSDELKQDAKEAA